MPATRYIQSELIHTLYQRAYIAIITTFIIATVILYFFHPVVSPQTLYSWYIIQLFVGLIRLLLTIRIVKKRWFDTPHLARRAEWIFLGGALITGIIWGSLAFFPLQDTDEIHYFSMMAFVEGGLAAGASMTMAASKRAFMLFVVPLLLPVTVKTFLQNDEIAFLMGIFMLFFTNAVVVINRENYSLVYSAFAQKYKNEGLLESIRQKNLELLKVNDEEKKLRQSMAEEIAARKKLEDELRELSTIDPLTGLYNRRFFITYANNLISQSERFYQITSMILIDIDNFKEINDTWGHQEGDLVLQNISRLFIEHTRKSDVVARYGGEEFIILAPHHDLVSGEILAGKLLHLVRQSKISDKREVTFSAGVCTLLPGMTLDQLVAKCDQALYQAKNNGKNQVVCCPAGF